MAYYCFLCNENHENLSTEEHFIPKSIGGPEDQWLPVCTDSNARSNSVFDSNVRDILYMARHRNTRILKRVGEALLKDGTLKQYKFSYDEPQALDGSNAFHYFFDIESKEQIPRSDIYAIAFSVGLTQSEQDVYCRGLAKISIGALAYLLKNEGIQDETIRQVFLQPSVDSARHFALNLTWHGDLIEHRFSLGQTDLLSQFQRSCENPQFSNHVIQIIFQEDNTIHIEGMLYSQYGWKFDLSNDVIVDIGELRLENCISDMPVPESLRDLTLSLDSIVIINPNYEGSEPTIPHHWQNNKYEKIMNDDYKRANIAKALVYFLFARRKYIELAITHSMALNLEAPDLRKKFEEGTFPPEDWEANYSAETEKAANQVHHGLWTSFLWVLTVFIIALGIGATQSTSHISFAINVPLFLSFSGTFLVGWATLMELGGGFWTWSGEALHELIHPAIFKILFIPGLLLIFTGIVL